jgi:hypothetical protein
MKKIFDRIVYLIGIVTIIVLTVVGAAFLYLEWFFRNNRLC